MPVDTTHPEYNARKAQWTLMRTLLAGERSVKRSGESLLPRNEGATDEQYEGYLSRAHYFNATARTADGYIGLLFRRAPRIRSFDRALEADFDLSGTTLLTYARTVVAEVGAVGRCGSYIDWSEAEGRAYAAFYRAEDILNWRVEVVDGRPALTLLVLREPQAEPDPADSFAHRTVDQIRVAAIEEGRLVVRVHRLRQSRWSIAAEFRPSRMGQPLARIPFVFHSPGPDGVAVAKLPLEDIAAANLDHYRLTAGQRNALHYVAMPILALAGFDPAKYGADTAQKAVGAPPTLVSESWDAKAAYVEHSGSGLDAFERALDRSERFMAMLGSRLLEPRKNVGETAEAIELRQSGEASVLGAMGLCISESLTETMRLMQWWGREEAPGEGLPRITLNADFNTHSMTPQQLRELVAAWQAGAMTKEELTEGLRRGEILPPNATPIVGDPES